MLTDDDGNIWIRQSWLDTAMRCAERGRFAIVKPELDSMSSDAAVIGTGAHAGAETIMLGGSYFEALAAIEKAIHEEDAIGILWKDYDSVEELVAYAKLCFDAWMKDLHPWVLENGFDGCKPEQEFAEPIYQLPDGRWVGIKGTVDLPTMKNVIIDWKTSKRPYRVWEKQRHAVQPSVYGWAAVRGALQENHYTWPLDFYYGVMIRPKNLKGEAATQIVRVRRTESHARWAFKQIQTFVDLSLKTGLDSSWPLVTENNFLCSQKWCPWYSLCRGAHITPFDDETVD